MRGADLSSSTVDRNTSFRGARLQGQMTKLPTTLGLTDLMGAKFFGTDLSGCDLSSGRLSHGHFEDTILPEKEAWLKNMDLSFAKLVRINLSSRSLSDVKFVGSTCEKIGFDASRLSGVDFTNATLEDCSFERAKLEKVVLPLSLSDVRFAGAKMDGLDLKERVLEKVDLTDATLRNAQLQGANLQLRSSTESISRKQL